MHPPARCGSASAASLAFDCSTRSSRCHSRAAHLTHCSLTRWSMVSWLDLAGCDHWRYQASAPHPTTSCWSLHYKDHCIYRASWAHSVRSTVGNLAWSKFVMAWLQSLRLAAWWAYYRKNSWTSLRRRTSPDFASLIRRPTTPMPTSIIFMSAFESTHCCHFLREGARAMVNASRALLCEVSTLNRFGCATKPLHLFTALHLSL